MPASEQAGPRGRLVPELNYPAGHSRGPVAYVLHFTSTLECFQLGDPQEASYCTKRRHWKSSEREH